MRRYFWLIPVLFLALAMIACDGPYYEPVRVKSVKADPQIPGKAYIVVSGSDPYGQINEGKDFRKVYETTDYGETWKSSDYPAFENSSSNLDVKQLPRLFYWSSGGIYAAANEIFGRDDSGGRLQWQFPRATFRYFFAPDTDTDTGQVYYRIDSYPDYDVSPADLNTVYIALGTEGVLVGPNPINPGVAPRSWKLSHNGIDTIRSLPLTITNPSAILGVILLGLLVPPLSCLHIWVLAQVYRYAFQDGESREAYKLAGIVTGSITGLAAIAIYIWLTDGNTDYYPIVSIMTLVCVTLGAGAGVWISRKRNFSALFQRRMAIAVVMVSALVPAGVASIWFLWPVILAAVFAFGIFRRAVDRNLDRQNAAATRWGVDRAALEIAAFVVFVSIPLVWMFFASSGFVIALPLFLLAVGVALLGMYKFSSRRLGRMVIKKKNSDVLESGLFRGRAWVTSLFIHSVSWGIAAGACSVLVFMMQLQAHSWFQTLIVEPAKRLLPWNGP